MRYPGNGIPRVRIRFGPGDYKIETRQQMIDSTNRYLSRMLNGKRRVPRIPRARVDQGGFDWIRKRPGARALAEHFWNRLLGR